METEKEKTFYYPWVRKGLGAYIDEKENLNGSAKGRAELTIRSDYSVQHILPKEKIGYDTTMRSLEKKVKFIGPGDILRVNPSAVMKVHPDADSVGFPKQLVPYIEFWEPDFLWRYTPASENQGKLRPWLSLVICRQEDIQFRTLSDGLTYFSFIGGDDAWNASFPSVDKMFLCAHAQGMKEDEPEFCRLLGFHTGDLMEETDYAALLIPTYETGRLRGLGYDEKDINSIAAQKPAWENSFSKQKSDRKQGLDFPVYYKWFFKTGTNDFDTIVKGLGVSKVEKPGLILDVTDMGEGFSYNTVEHENSRPSIVMPAATLTLDYRKEPAFPAKDIPKYDTEGVLYDNLEWMMEHNPVFAENKANSIGKDVGEDPGDEDPWIVPPAYGARHAMAFRIDDPEEPKPWLRELNMDIHYRVSAGLGRSVVQKHQEELMDRAWKQVEAIQALNMELYRRLLSIQANKSLRRKTVDQYASDGDSDKYIEYMMRYLSSMMNAGADKISLSSIIGKAGIPAAFAAPSFQNNTEKLARYVSGMDATTLMEHIVKDQLFRFSPAEPAGALDAEALSRWCLNSQEALAYRVFDNYWNKFLSLKCSANSGLYTVGVVQKSVTTARAAWTPYEAVIQHLTDDLKGKDAEGGYYEDKDIYDAVHNFSQGKEIECYSHPRLYVMNDNAFDSLSKKDGISFHEDVGKLSFPKNPEYLDLSLEALSIPEGMFKDFFGEADLANIGEGNYSYFSYYKLKRREDFTAWRVFLGENKVAGTTNRYYEHGAILPELGSITPLLGWDQGHDEETVYLIKYHLERSIKRANVSCYEVFKEFRRFLKSEFDYPLKTGFVRGLKNYNINNYPDLAQTHKDCYSEYQWDLLVSTFWGEGPSFQDLVSIQLNFMSSFLFGFIQKSKVLGNGSYFCKFWNSAVNAAFHTTGQCTLLSALCFNKTFGGWFLSKLPLLIYGGKVTGISELDDLKSIHNYLRDHPAFVIIPRKTFDKLKKTEFKGDEFVESVRKKAQGEGFYKEAYDYFQKLNGDIHSQKEAFVPKASGQTPDTPEQPAINDKDVSEYQESIVNKEAYESMKSVAERYYENFYANDKEGERLREGYLDDLLRSKYPILAYPFFPEPTFHYLKMVSDRFIIPGMDEIADESVAMFKSNPAFTEAFLCGMNTEMGTELQWREYPTDRRGSYFRKFWDSESSVAAIQSDTFFDVKPLHLWGNTPLGGNHLKGKDDLLIFAVKSELFRLYPDTKVYLNKAKKADGSGHIVLDEEKIPAVMETFAREDVFLVGFKIKVLKALGNPDDKDYGYMLTFEQNLDDLNFANLEDNSAFNNSAEAADALKDRVTIVAKHVSLFV